MIITAIFGGIVSCIGAWNARQARNASTEVRDKQNIVAEKAEKVAEKAEDNSTKLDQIHSLTNGNLSRTQEELEQAIRRRDFLEKVLIELTSNCPPGTLETATKNVEIKQAQIGKRRKSDVKGDGNNRKGDMA